MANKAVVQGLGSRQYLTGGYWAFPNYSGVITQGFGFPGRPLSQGYVPSYYIAGSGGMQHGGISTRTRSASIIASGGVKRGGVLTLAISYLPAHSGGMKLSAKATYGKIFTQASAGGVLRGGAATRVMTFVPPHSGGINRGGNGAYGKVYAQAASGGFTPGAVFFWVATLTPPIGGGIADGGKTSPNASYLPAHSGGFRDGSLGRYKLSIVKVASGGFREGGSSRQSRILSPVASGGMRSHIASKYLYTTIFRPSGGIHPGAHAGPILRFHPSPIGGVRRGGHCAFGTIFVPPHSGGMAIHGTPILVVGHSPLIGIGGFRLGAATIRVDDTPVSFLAALVALMRSSPMLVNAIGGPRIYSTWPGDRTPMPYVVIDEFVEDQPGDTLESVPYVVQFTVRGRTRDSVRVVSDALKLTVDSPAQNVQSRRDRLAWAGGVEDYSWRRPTTSPMRLPKTAYGADLFAWSILYEFNVTLSYQA